MQPTNQVSDVIVVDGTPQAQAWMDAVVTSARAGGTDWPHPHDKIPRGRVTLERLHATIAAQFNRDGRPWKVEVDGYPPVTGEIATAAAREPHEDPSRGSAMHNLLHSILGNFH